MEETIENLKDEARRSCPGHVGESRAVDLGKFLREMLANYSAVLGIPQPDLLAAFEKRRSYSAINYYQRANFPSLDKVTLLKDLAEFKQRYPSGRYICPLCGGESTNAYECNTGRSVGQGNAKQICNWKSYGLFRTAGKGMRIVLLDGFLENPKVQDIFMPLEAVVAQDLAVAHGASHIT